MMCGMHRVATKSGKSGNFILIREYQGKKRDFSINQGKSGKLFLFPQEKYHISSDSIKLAYFASPLIVALLEF